MTSIGYATVRVSSAKALRAVTLPDSTSFINVFAVSLLPASAPAPASSQNSQNSAGVVHLSVQNVRSTTKWMFATNTTNGEKLQQIEITLNNLSPLTSGPTSWITRAHNLTLALASDALDTVVPARVVRLRSNDQVVVNVGVRNRPGVRVGASATVRVVVSSSSGVAAAGTVVVDGVNGLNGENGQGGWEVVAGIPEWVDGDESLRTHEAPDWVSACAWMGPCAAAYGGLA